MVDEKTNAESWTRSKRWCGINALQDNISHKVIVSIELDGEYNVRTIQFRSHRAELIRWYQAWQLYSGERHEAVHKTSLKDGWSASNHNLNYLLQVITFQRHIRNFEIR
jgi:hypothetical protein